MNSKGFQDSTMDGQQLIKSSQLKPGRHTWLARVPFGVAALGGGIGLIVAKTKGADQFWVTAAAIGLILAYAFIVYRVNALRLREDQLGDNCYYLGFLYTLASLAWALNEFGRTGAIEAIVSNFGL